VHQENLGVTLCLGALVAKISLWQKRLFRADLNLPDDWRIKGYIYLKQDIFLTRSKFYSIFWGMEKKRSQAIHLSHGKYSNVLKIKDLGCIRNEKST
jgi:hypothetical protein